MSDNIVAIYGDVPELVEKQSAEIISQFLKSDRDDFNFVKYIIYTKQRLHQLLKKHLKYCLSFR